MAVILIVDDEFSIRKTLGLLLKAEGHTVHEAGSLAEAKERLEQAPADLVMTDLRLGEDDGIAVLEHLRASGSDAESIVMTAYGTIESAVEAMRLGAYDYLTKPINPAELVIRVTKVLERKSLREEVTRLRGALDGRHVLAHVVAESPQMQRVLQVIERIRDRDLPVLITGETGTGKEVVARAVHATSTRAAAPFLAINCATLPEDLLDSELFGSLKGAFTGAVANRKGLFREAHGGTLFLDEIGDISPRLQAKLLRVLQEGEVRPVGGDTPTRVDVRIVAATNRDLDRMVEAGEFRSDLLFRLNVLPIALPPLRERREDILPLVRRVLERLRREPGRDNLGLTPPAQEKLLRYDWPGNVRQLENIIERSFALHPGPVLDAHEILITPAGVTQPTAGPEAGPELPADIPLAEVESLHIRRVLERQGGNQVAAARVLGISRSTLRRKLGQNG
ncbi:sigma-54-dependent transcriptional regulator [Thioalbus denitrificans]|uniref:Two component Fis family sigma54 specific transcriptional regulator n=1 Tax=Thioalbus denitrificans TaxID=547122 RepID=A0A369CHW6_9GAMM|nr:sigma-54 dependent transcriptional regulator [Thioalbus denitrificans]RCX33519.1 two component Fis family sigma54 specific transcriptional regulator [Thioalbus denitrificans]